MPVKPTRAIVFQMAFRQRCWRRHSGVFRYRTNASTTQSLSLDQIQRGRKLLASVGVAYPLGGGDALLIGALGLVQAPRLRTNLPALIVRVAVSRICLDGTVKVFDCL